MLVNIELSIYSQLLWSVPNRGWRNKSAYRCVFPYDNEHFCFFTHEMLFLHLNRSNGWENSKRLHTSNLPFYAPSSINDTHFSRVSHAASPSCTSIAKWEQHRRKRRALYTNIYPISCVSNRIRLVEFASKQGVGRRVRGRARVEDWLDGWAGDGLTQCSLSRKGVW